MGEGVEVTEGIVGTIREGELVTIGSKEAGCVGEKEVERPLVGYILSLWSAYHSVICNLVFFRRK